MLSTRDVSPGLFFCIAKTGNEHSQTPIGCLWNKLPNRRLRPRFFSEKITTKAIHGVDRLCFRVFCPARHPRVMTLVCGKINCKLHFQYLHNSLTEHEKKVFSSLKLAIATPSRLQNLLPADYVELS